MKKLILVESPAKCNKILSFLDDTYLCEATYGHLREIKSLKNIQSNFEMQFTNIPEKNQQINKIQKKMQKCNEIIIATDDDREGEGIAWHVLQLFNLPITTKRIKFNSITKDAILYALEHPGTIDMNMVASQQTRQILDLLVGFKISPILWSEISRKSGLSAGRCQTPALHMLYENYQKIKDLQQEMFYQIQGYFTSKNIKFTLNTVFDEENKMLVFLKTCHKISSYDLTHEIKENVKKTPPKPFVTSSLQQTCSSLFNMSPKECMSTCQTLYEAGHITYMRTDSYFLSDKFKKECGIYIINNHGNEYFNKGFISSDKKNSQQAHEAIRPTDINNIPKLSGRQEKVYTLIRKRTIQSLMTNAIVNTYKFTAFVNDNYSFVNTQEQIVFKGWLILENIEEDNYISYLCNLQKIHANKILCDPSFRNTSLHYTEARLIKELEDKNIGRPSTFASIIEKLKERKYAIKGNVDGKLVKTHSYELNNEKIVKKKVEKQVGAEKNKLIIQPLGILVIEILMKSFRPLFQYDFTEKMENSLDNIANGEHSKVEIASSFTRTIENLIVEYNKIEKSKMMIDENHEFIISKNGPVLKCTINNETIFKKVKADFDIEMLRQGKYSVEDIVDDNKTEKILGEYKNIQIVLKTGKYGQYVEYGGKNISIRHVDKEFDDILLADVIDILDGNKDDNRVITNEISIKKGKFGDYIYYKTNKMSKPKFINLKKFEHNYKDCDKELIIQYVESNI